MYKLNSKVDEATLLKAYRIRSLAPKKWEDVDHELEGTLAGSLTGSAISESDPLGLGSSRLRKDTDMKAKASISIVSKTFDPATYLSTVHPNATYHDLAKGVAHLQHSMDARSEALRTLVEDSFDRFVAVKSCTHGLYEDMKTEILAPESDFATKQIREKLKSGVRKASQVFLPVLETASKAEKLGLTLRIFERSKFFFNLPSFILESIATGRYELALRDYKKGKYILENRPSQLLPISNKDGTSSATAQQQQIRILTRVWGNVENAMGELKKVLIKQLQDTSRSTEEQEKTLETLLELQPNDDPIWAYFDSHHEQIMAAMTESYRAGVKLIDYAIRETSLTEGSQSPGTLSELVSRELQQSVLQLEARKESVVIAISSAEAVWQAIFDLVRKVSESVTSALPAFWRISKDFIEGKIKKNSSSSGTRRSPSQCRNMAFDIVRLYISLLSQLFVLSDMVVMESSDKNGIKNNYPPRLPTNSHSLSTAYHLQNICSEVQHCVNDIVALNISSDVRSGLKCLMDSLKWRFADTLARDWVRDADLFYNLEFWIAHWDAASSSTRYLAQFDMFQKYMMASSYKIVVSNDPPESNRTSSRKRATPKILSNKIVKAFFEAIHAFLDGLALLASEDSPIVKKPEIIEGKGSMEMSLHERVDLKNANNRLLVVISNLTRFSKMDLPSMINQLESILGPSFEDEKCVTNDLIEELDGILFERYTKPRVKIFKICLRSAVSKAEINWYTSPIPVVIRPYAFEILNYLVEVHAHICTVAPALLDKALTALTDELVSEVSRAFRQVPRFGMGGFLTATMEITFIQRALGIYTKDTHAGRTIDNLAKQIGKLCDPLTRNPEFQTALHGTQKVLGHARKATDLQFLCFTRVEMEEGSSIAKHRSRMQGTRKSTAAVRNVESEGLT